MQKILLYQKIVPSYRVGIFRELYIRLGILTCHSLHNPKGSWESSYMKMDYPNELLSAIFYGHRETSIIQNVISPLIKYKPVVVISEFTPGYLPFWMLLILRPFYKFKLIIWTHGIKNNELLKPFISIKGKIALFAFLKSDALILYSNKRAELLKSVLPFTKPIFVAPNTLDTSKYFPVLNALKLQGKTSIKNEIGFKNKYNLIYVGRLNRKKRIDLLLQSFELLHNKLDIQLHIIGEGDKEILHHITRSKAVTYHGGIYEEELIGKYLFASDVFVMPGAVGLGIVHALCFGLPVITCERTIDGPFHSPEFEYLINGYNSILCPSNALDIADSVTHILNNPVKYSSNALKTAEEECNITKMCSGFNDAIEFFH